jgi:hypothetical protein
MALRTILSIDGGGIKGALPALVLAYIEKQTGKRIADCFDLIAGTSTGGILSLALTATDSKGVLKYTADDVFDMYKDHGKDIFSRSALRSIFSIGGIVSEKYSDEGIVKVLKRFFTESATLNTCHTKTFVTTYDIENRTPLFLKSWKADTKNTLLWQAARGTSAAPTYFEPAKVKVNGLDRILIDGGVYVNNPSLSASIEAKKLFPDDDLLVVSIGTGQNTRSIPYESAKDWGDAQWVVPLLDIMFDGQSAVTDYQLSQVPNVKMFRFQTRLNIASDSMDDVSDDNISKLKKQATKLIVDCQQSLDELCDILKQSPTRAD